MGRVSPDMATPNTDPNDVDTTVTDVDSPTNDTQEVFAMAGSSVKTDSNTGNHLNQAPHNPSSAADTSVKDPYATVPLSAYDLRPPHNPFVNNNLIAAMGYPGTPPALLPVPAQQTRKFNNFSINAKGNFANQHWDRTFLCTICNDGTARETTTARQHHARYHKDQDFETVTQEGKKERWKAYNLARER